MHSGMMWFTNNCADLYTLTSITSKEFYAVFLLIFFGGVEGGCPRPIIFSGNLLVFTLGTLRFVLRTW